MVYITSKLFDTENKIIYHPSNADLTQACNTTVDFSGAGKRKRGLDCGDESTSTRPSTFQRTSPTPRSLSRVHGHNVYLSTPVSLSAQQHSDRRPLKQLRRVSKPTSLVKFPSHVMEIEAAEAQPHTNFSTSIPCDLRPCHACGTAPKRKRDLENYMECTRCEGRSCYICARECIACGKGVCKKCIVEEGEEGDPWCLECYARHINGQV